MIDNFAIGLTHALMLLTALIVMRRPELDREGPPEKGWRTPRD